MDDAETAILMLNSMSGEQKMKVVVAILMRLRDKAGADINVVVETHSDEKYTISVTKEEA